MDLTRPRGQIVAKRLLRGIDRPCQIHPIPERLGDLGDESTDYDVSIVYIDEIISYIAAIDIVDGSL
jgi:hypothetical protein